MRRFALRQLSISSSKRFQSSVGFIGLGNMGANMASNLLKNPQFKDNLYVFDVSSKSVQNLVEKGAKAASIQEMASLCNTIITMVPATKHVTEILRNETGIFKNGQKGTLIIDCSTIDPLASKDLNEEANRLGMSMIDAPVSGGVTGAAAGTLTFMVGGTESDLDRAKPFLQSMGKNIVHCGGAGNGGITKLCNNLSLAISMIGTCEAMALGKRLGMDSKKLSEVMNTSTARCWSSDSYSPVPGLMPNVPSSRGYTGGFGSALMLKDLSLAMNASQAVGGRLPLGAQAQQLYGLLCEHGYAEKDFSSVFEFLTHSNK